MIVEPAQITLHAEGSNVEDTFLDGVILSVEAYFRTDFGRPHVELIEGSVRMVPPPNDHHEVANYEMGFRLESLIRTSRMGRLYRAPAGLRLNEDSVVQPDLFWLAEDHPRIDAFNNRAITIPSLVVEVLAPSNANYDLTTKKALYASAGVPHYWVVDPMRRTISGLSLEEGAYQEVVFAESGEFSSAPFPELSIPLAAVFPWAEIA